jgi:hypothetical protein
MRVQEQWSWIDDPNITENMLNLAYHPVSCPINAEKK